LLAITAPDRAALGADRILQRLPTLLSRGTSAHAQLQAYHQARSTGASPEEALRSVVDWLIVRTTQKIGTDERIDTRP